MLIQYILNILPSKNHILFLCIKLLLLSHIKLYPNDQINCFVIYACIPPTLAPAQTTTCSPASPSRRRTRLHTWTSGVQPLWLPENSWPCGAAKVHIFCVLVTELVTDLSGRDWPRTDTSKAVDHLWLILTSILRIYEVFWHLPMRYIGI